MKNFHIIFFIVFLLLIGAGIYFFKLADSSEELILDEPATETEIPSRDSINIPTPNSDDEPNSEPKSKPTVEDLIILDYPRAQDTISSPLIIKGEARGTWFFEANFPIVLTDWDGRIIAEGYATALDEWMTEEYVPFEATIKFETPNTNVSNRGSLILQRANPSDLPENDNALEITVYYK